METIKQFLTQDLGFACFLYAAHKLKFVGCKDAANGKVNFMFNDPNGDGENHRMEFEAGAEVPAVTFMDTIRHMRRVMDAPRRRATYEPIGRRKE
jgi:hypothetical protein